MSYNWKNKVVLITGASSGFGKALAQRIVNAGAKVALGDIDEAAGSTLVQSLGTSNAVFSRCDVTKRVDQQILFDLAVSTFGTIDVVVNNAGIGDYSNFYADDGNDKHWEAVIRIDLDAVIIGNRIAYNYFAEKARKGGIIINTASLAGIYPQPLQPVYGVAKAGVVHLTRSIATHGKDAGIYSVAICPSYSPTGIIDKGVAVHGEAFNATTANRVPVEKVIDAFVYSIENAERLNGHAVRITSQIGMDVYTFGKGKPFKL